jgi:hypothetical protein
VGGTKSPHVAIGTSAIAVSFGALDNVIGHWRAGNVKWRCAAVFVTVGIFGALGGAALAKAMNGQGLLALFGILMLVVELTMLRRRRTSRDPGVELSANNAATLLPWLIEIGATVGFLSGFFGNFRAATAQPRVIKEEEPLACIRCGKPSGVKSTIERVAADLEGKHWMYKGSRLYLDVIRMCDDCRVAAMTESGFDPLLPERSRLRTTDDYLKK